MYMYEHVCGLHGNSDLNINDSFPLSFLQILHTRIHLRSIVLKVALGVSPQFVSI